MKMFWIDNRLYIINDNDEQVEINCDFPLAWNVSHKADVELDYDFTGTDLQEIINDLSDFFGCNPCIKGQSIWDKIEEIQNTLNTIFTHEDLTIMIESIMTQASDLVIPGYRLGRVTEEELEVMILEGLKDCLAASDIEGMLLMIWEKLSNNNTDDAIHSINDLKEYISEIHEFYQLGWIDFHYYNKTQELQLKHYTNNGDKICDSEIIDINPTEMRIMYAGVRKVYPESDLYLED